jgi:Holliday junction resolvase RusA-like endonuclease
VSRIDIRLAVLPPKTTSQMKRAVWTKAGPRFFKSKDQQEAEHTYLSLLAPYRPAVPLEGAVALDVTFTWPHLAGTPKRLRDTVQPKTTRPDADNIVKALQDCLVRLRFLKDDGQIARLSLTKYHGPEAHVGVRVVLTSFDTPFPDEEHRV